MTMKWRNRIAQGFYEAELVNSALQKSISWVKGFLDQVLGKKVSVTGSLVFGRCGVGVRRRNEQTPEAVSAFEARFCGLLD